MTTYSIFGLSAMNELPVCEPLVVKEHNDKHVNFIELARAEFDYQSKRGRIYDGIQVIVGCDASFVYSFK